MLAAATVAASALVCSPGLTPMAVQVRAPAPVVMAAETSRRDLLSTVAAAGAAALAPAAAFADGAASKNTREKVFIQQGSRVWRLQGADAATILSEKNAFKIFAEGAYAGLKEKKPLSKELNALGDKAVKAAKAGDSSGAQAAVKEFVALAKITKEQDTVKGGSFNPKQRRNAGDPPTEAIEGQMGTEVGALYGNMKLK